MDLNIADVDILINNAGVVVGKMLLELSEEEIERTIRVNLLGQFWVITQQLQFTLFRLIIFIIRCYERFCLACLREMMATW